MKSSRQNNIDTSHPGPINCAFYSDSYDEKSQFKLEKETEAILNLLEHLNKENKLFGYLNYGKHVPWKILQKLVQSLANASEVRGDHASGIAYNRDNHLTVYKRPKPAHKLKFRLPDGTAAVMGHTRFTTQGSEKQNYNNHPFRGNAGTDFALAHNGVLYNDTTLRKAKSLPDTHIETDSYIAVQLIEKQGALNFTTIRHMAEDVHGSFVFTILDEDNSLWFVKGDNPLHLIHFPALGLYVYASTASIMAAALMHSPLCHIPYEAMDADEGDILRIHSNGKVTREYFRPMFFSLRNGYAERCNTGSDENFTLLLDMCGYFGVSEDEVRCLIDAGYSYDEIEEFLLNPSLLDEEYFYSEL